MYKLQAVKYAFAHHEMSLHPLLLESDFEMLASSKSLGLVQGFQAVVICPQLAGYLASGAVRVISAS